MDVRQIFLTVSLHEQATQGLVNTKNFVNETTHQTINNLTELTNQSINSVTETAAQANHTLSTLTDEAKQSLTQTVDTIAEKAKQTETSWLVTSDKITSYLEDNLQKLEELSNTISTEIERSFNTLINHQLDKINYWIDGHPVISWMLKFLTWSINHPLVALIGFLLVIFIIWQFFKVFSRFLEQGLLATLTAPFKLLAPLLKLSFKPLTSLKSNSQVMPIFNSHNKQDRLSKLLTRLEAIKQEQDHILQEITAIVLANTNFKKE
jgi:hypothetical protein